MRIFHLLLLAMVLVASLVADAAHVCKNKDCSDIVGDHLVKDNLGKSEHFNDHHHEEWREEARRHRAQINRRERPDA